jgi:subtilisin family serine protease
MKKVSLIIPVVLVMLLTSMVLIAKKNTRENDLPQQAYSHPMLHKGMITIKVKKGVGEFLAQRGPVSFNIPSLNLKADKYQVDLLEKRFIYNPKKLKRGLPDLSRIYRIEFPEEYSVLKVAEEFSKDPNIEYAEPVPVNYFLEEPNDSLYSQLHHLPQIFAPEAWEIHKGEDGDEEIVIAIVDSGVDWDHEDLIDNIWQNLGEDADGDGHVLQQTLFGEWVFDPGDENGIDDDENGYIDDFIGWNFFFNNNDPNPVPGTPNNSHGTHCAGIASATTNNGIGIASISWNLKIFPIESGLDSSILKCYDAIIYAAENGADVISNSWAAHHYSQANHEVITYANGLGSIIIAAGGNNNLFSNFYPADYPGVISVAAVNVNDYKAGFSNFGPNIGISAPGVGIKSTMPNDSYAYGSGTSMATPMVAGLMGLVKSYYPNWTRDQVITRVLGSADDIDTINPGYENLLGAGRINAQKALDTSSVSLQQEISLDLVYSSFLDSDSNFITEPGDTLSLYIKFRNYNYGVGDENANFTLLSDDQDIEILDGTCAGEIPPDDYFSIENELIIRVSEFAGPHLTDLKLITTSDKLITWGDTIIIPLIVAPTGTILVFQGEGSGNAYSGDFINEFLVNYQGRPVLYTSYFPSSLNGFDAVFLSYGNYGDRLDDGTPWTLEMTGAIAAYLYLGGRVYLECGTLFGGLDYWEYPNMEEIYGLFGISENQYLLNNPINLLTGINNSICNGLVFEGSSQSPNWYIDNMTPDTNGLEALEEDNYGTVAVQAEGEFGQKTFCFSYALAHLEDGSQGTKEELLSRIVDWLLLGVGIEDKIAEEIPIEIKVFPSPFSENTSIQFTLELDSYIKLEIIDLTGHQVALLCNRDLRSGDYSFSFSGKNLASGIYLCCLHSSNQVIVKKLLLQ